MNLHVGYVLTRKPEAPEDRAALHWLETQDDLLPRPLSLTDEPVLAALTACDVVWIHRDQEPLTLPPADREALQTYVQEGGRLLLTNFAASLPHDLGFEARRPDAQPRVITDEGFGRAYGFQSFRGHPVLNAFHGGGALWHAATDHTAWRVGYFDDAWPVEGRVVGVEKGYITLWTANKLLIEHTVGAGRLLSVGAFVYLDPTNYRAQHLRRFLHDALRYLAQPDLPEKATYWIDEACVPRSVTILPLVPGRAVTVSQQQPDQKQMNTPRPYGAPLSRKDFARADEDNPLWRGVPSAARRGVSTTGPRQHNDDLNNPAVLGEKDTQEAPALSLRRDPATEAFFDVAGRRCLMIGQECGGLDEVWVHPVRLLCDFEMGLVVEGAVQWLRAIPAQVEIRPEAIVRTYPLHTGVLTETVLAAIDKPGGLIYLHADGTGPLSVLLRFRVDLRWMWPFPEDTPGALRFGYDDGLHALHVHDRRRAFYALFGSDRPPDAQRGGAFARIEYAEGRLQGTPTDLNQIYQAFLFTLDETNHHTLHFAIAGGDRGRGEAEETLCALLGDPAGIYDEAARHYQRLLKTSTMVTTPDPVFNEGYRWAVVGTDRCRATTPGLGTGLLAGYGTSRMGWDGGHALSGRPGYAWYFGRDAAWAGLAVCAYGGFEAIRHQLRLFQTFQDLSGKIFHEMTTSGSIHYDAADATPLYIILVAHYLRASGDLDTLRTLQPSLRRAMDFLFSTDTDSDGLIENTNVGHGWIEGGPLFGAHTTLYLTALWAQTLRDAAYLATLLDEPATAAHYARTADAVLDTLDQQFWNEETGFFHHSLRPDGTFTPEPTVLAAVPMLFALLDPARTDTMLDALAGNDFSTNWGLRLLSIRSPQCNPESYHGGTVWPLFTGWTALAEYAYGRPAQGFAHAMNTLLLYRHHALGFADEVLHGTRFEPRRVCPHQCWSETAVLHPILTGLVGFHPDAPRRVLRLEPRLPLHWDTVQVDTLWIGTSRLSLAMRRAPTRTTYHLTLTEGLPVQVTFAPEIPHGMNVHQILVQGALRPPSGRGPLGLLEPALPIILDAEATIELHHTGGLGVIPSVPHPAPGDASRGVRIIREAMEEAAYSLTVEGPAGSTALFQIKTYDQSLTRIDGAEHVETSDDGGVTVRVTFDDTEEPYLRKTVRFYV